MKEERNSKKYLRVKGRYYRWFPPERYLGHTEEILTLDVSQTAFVLVDAYIPEKEKMVAKEEEKKPLSEKEYHLKRIIVEDYIAPCLRMARKVNLPIIYVANSAPKIAIEKSEFAKKILQSGGFSIEEEFVEEKVDPLEYHHGCTEQISFPPSIKPLSRDIYIRKHTYSGFFDTRLETVLRNMEIKNLVFSGFRLDACLGCTMFDALYRNFKVILLRDCTLACELPEEIGNIEFTKRMILWFEVLTGTSVDSKDFVAACETIL